MTKDLRILHAVGKMDRGGIETWLMNLLRRIDRRAVTFDFLVETAERGAYDEEIRDLGARVIHVERTRRLWEYGPALARTLNANGPYDAIHSHVHLFGGFILGVAATRAVPVRIAHSHTALSAAAPRPDVARRVYYGALREMLSRSMTHGLAVSTPAAVELFGHRFRQDRRVRVLPCAIDCTAFQRHDERWKVRREYAIPDDAKVIGTVGRLDPEKNQEFLIGSFADAAGRDARLHLLIVGGGKLQSRLAERARDCGFGNRITFAGVRADVPSLMASMDVFAFPSRYEGLGLVLIEAQASGLPIVVSDTVPTEALIDGHWIKRLSPADQNSWAAAMIDAANLPREARRPSFDPRFDIDLNLRELLALYGAPDTSNAIPSRAAAG